MRKYICIMGFIIFSFAFVFNVQAIKFKIYEVKSGDTLWSISNRFYGSPFYWYFIWEANKTKVKNPHWIFPGQDLKIPPREFVKARLKGLKIEKPKKPLLHWEQQVFIDYITKNLPPKFGILQSEIYDIDKTLFSQEDLVGMKILNKTEIKPGKIYLIYRVGDFIKDPYTGRKLGYFISNIGLVKVIKVIGDYALCKVLKTTASLMSGDIATSFEMPEPIYQFKDAKGELSARIVALVEDKATADLLDMVFLNVGRDSNLKNGDVLYVYQKPYNVIVGKLLVIKVAEDATTCLVGKIKRILVVGDYVATKDSLK